MKEFFLKLFDSSDFPARWHCGNWSDFDGWFYILSDLSIFAAYAAIPLSIVFFVLIRRRETVFTRLYWLFAAFILSCGFTHLIDALIFWYPVYRVLAVVKFITAIASWAAVITLLRTLPTAMSLPGTVKLNQDLQREVEQHKQAAAALQESTTRLGLAIQHSHLGDFSWDANTGMTAFSPRAAEIFGISPEISHSRAEVFSLIHPDDSELTDAAFKRAFLERSDYDVEYRIARANDGQEVWVNAKGRGSYTSAGRVLGMIGTVQDITERKRIEAEREQLLVSERTARSEAERASRMKDEFLATLSHELRTPLNAILGWTHLLKNEADETQRTEGLEIIERNSRLQAQLIEDLLDMNRIITGKVRLEVQMVDLGAIIHAALDGVRPSADSKQIHLVTDLEPLAEPVHGDPARLQQIVWNLLTNAIKFTPTGGRVEITLRRADLRVEISVSDSGTGISPDFLPFVFDRFRQADASTTRKHGGLGLGLAIVKNLTELHGGTAQARSDGENLGAAFLITLPLATAKLEPPAASDSPHPVSKTSEAAGGTELPDLTGVRVLLVDDERDSLAMLRRVLERQGMLVSTASSGLETLDELRRQTFQIIVSDIGMPGMDGFELIQKIRELPPEQGGQIPVVALTAFARAEDRQRATDAGFDSFISKPVELAALLSVLAQHLHKDRA